MRKVLNGRQCKILVKTQRNSREQPTGQAIDRLRQCMVVQRLKANMQFGTILYHEVSLYNIHVYGSTLMLAALCLSVEFYVSQVLAMQKENPSLHNS